MKLHWSPEKLRPEHEDRLRAALELWRGTPYHVHAQRPGAGVDCWRFVSAVADDMRPRPWIKLPPLLADVSMHSPETARAALRWAMREHDCLRVDGTSVRSGDVIVVGPKGGGPGHAMIAGPDRFVWHVTQDTGVCRTGLGDLGMDFHGILRVRSNTWA